MRSSRGASTRSSSERDHVTGLRKSYGGHVALRGIDFTIAAGEVFGLLGPNGAGKTTTVEILEGYRKRDAGERRGARRRSAARRARWRERVGVVLQSSSLYPNLTVRESLDVFAGYYPRAAQCRRGDRDRRPRREAGRARRTLSGGQQRRLDLGLALIGDPELIFLDEPTTGFDPARAERVGDDSQFAPLGKTILLTTHYLDEAEQLADRVAVLRDGVIVREGAPSELTGGASKPRSATGAAVRSDRADDASRRSGCTSSPPRRSPAARSSKASRCAGRRSRTSIWS